MQSSIQLCLSKSFEGNNDVALFRILLQVFVILFRTDEITLCLFSPIYEQLRDKKQKETSKNTATQKKIHYSFIFPLGRFLDMQRTTLKLQLFIKLNSTFELNKYK